MSVTPSHPNLAIEGSLTHGEMLDMIMYEGLVGLGNGKDIDVALDLQRLGLVQLVSDPTTPHAPEKGIPHIVSLIDRTELNARNFALS